MEVTDENFGVEYTELLSAIEWADFLSFDCEFTGIGQGLGSVVAFDTPQIVYSKLAQNVDRFLLMQFGLCAFRFKEEDNSYEYQCFNCFVYPRVPKKFECMRVNRGTTSGATCFIQPDVLHMLALSGFDFNKWINHGIGYMRQSEVDAFKREVSKMDELRTDNLDRRAAEVCTCADLDGVDVSRQNKIPDVMKPIINKWLKRVESYFKSDDAANNEFTIDDLNSYRRERWIIEQQLQQLYARRLFVRMEIAGKGSYSKVIVRKCSDDESYAGKQAELLASRKNKTLVGHNMFLDLLHTCKAFCFDLPGSFSDFQTQANAAFPHVMDTKVLCAQEPLKKQLGLSPSLGDLWERLNKNPFSQVKFSPKSAAYGYSDDCLTSFHDAGYDAYVTGCVLVKMATFYGQRRVLAGGAAPSSSETKNYKVPWHLLLPYKNRLAIPRVQDIPTLGLDPKSSANPPFRRHVFHLSFLDPTKYWTTDDVVKLFQKYGRVYVNWINRSSTFVALQRQSEAQKVFSEMCGGANVDNGQWRLTTCEAFTNAEELRIKALTGGDVTTDSTITDDGDDGGDLSVSATTTVNRGSGGITNGAGHCAAVVTAAMTEDVMQVE